MCRKGRHSSLTQSKTAASLKSPKKMEAAAHRILEPEIIEHPRTLLPRQPHALSFCRDKKFTIYIGLSIPGGQRTLTVTWLWYNLVHKIIKNIMIEKNSYGDKKIWEEMINRVNNLFFFLFSSFYMCYKPNLRFWKKNLLTLYTKQQFDWSSIVPFLEIKRNLQRFFLGLLMYM